MDLGSATPAAKRWLAVAVLALCGAPSTIHATPFFEFIDHNGFEACWSGSKDNAGMEQLLVDLVDGAPGCISAVTSGDFTFCYTSTCDGGQAGCPTVLHAASSQYQSGTGRFDTVGGLSSVSGKATLPLVGECDFSIDTTNVSLYYPVNYYIDPDYGGLIPDGNNGFYLTALSIGDVQVSGLAGAAVSYGGSIGCTIAAIPLSYATSILAQVQPSLEALVLPTLDIPRCPYVY